jgi:hypothetical protein
LWSPVDVTAYDTHRPSRSSPDTSKLIDPDISEEG